MRNDMATRYEGRDQTMRLKHTESFTAIAEIRMVIKEVKSIQHHIVSQTTAKESIQEKNHQFKH